MEKEICLVCQSCERSFIVKDPLEEIDPDDIKHCIFCGSEDISEE